MGRRPWQMTCTGLSLLALAALLVGCPKRPSLAPTAATASSPSGSVSGAPGGVGGAATGGGPATGTAPGASVGAAAATGGTTLPALPSPSEFSETSALEDIHFDFDRSAIRPADAKILDKDVTWLKATARALVLIEGHCDERGTDEYNLALGERRAKATRDYFAAHGIDPARVTTISYGKERPLCTAHTEACWARNRRAHMLVKVQ